MKSRLRKMVTGTVVVAALGVCPFAAARSMPHGDDPVGHGSGSQAIQRAWSAVVEWLAKQGVVVGWEDPEGTDDGTVADPSSETTTTVTNDGVTPDDETGFMGTSDPQG